MDRFQPDYSVSIRVGRAYVRLIEAAAVLIEWEEDEPARRSLVVMRRRSLEALRKFVALLPPHIVAEIMAASEKVHGTARNVSLN